MQQGDVIEGEEVDCCYYEVEVQVGQEYCYFGYFQFGFLYYVIGDVVVYVDW